MPTLRECFGQNLRFIRKSKNLTQEKLAEKINLDIRQYSRIETGKGFPSLATLENICSVLDISPAYLFDFTPDKEVYNKKSPEKEIYMKIKNISDSPQKLKFIELSLEAVQGNRKAIVKLQNILEGMCIINE